MRLLILILSCTTLVSCTALPEMPAKSHQTQANPIEFNGQSYANQVFQCRGLVNGNRGQIAWISATTTDSITKTVKYYNQQTGIAKRRTKSDEHLWAVVDESKPIRRSLAVMSINKAQHLTLMCNNPIPALAQGAIIISTFTTKQKPKPDYQHAAP